MAHRITSFLLLLVLLLVSILGTALASTRHKDRDDLTGHIPSTREELLAKRDKRKDEFTMRLEELKQLVNDHNSGRRRLQPGELSRFERKMKAYEEKLKYLNEEIDDRHIKRLLDREALLNEMHRERIARRSEL